MLNLPVRVCSLEDEVLAWVWISHRPHFGHNNSICFHVSFIGVTSEESASMDYFTCKETNTASFICALYIFFLFYLCIFAAINRLAAVHR